jgi:hypothetical protein
MSDSRAGGIEGNQELEQPRHREMVCGIGRSEHAAHSQRRDFMRYVATATVGFSLFVAGWTPPPAQAAAGLSNSGTSAFVDGAQLILTERLRG